MTDAFAPYVLHSFDASIHSAKQRANFDCGVTELNHYLQQQVSQDSKRRITRCFVAINTKSDIAGFYTLAATSILLNQLPDMIAKKLPRYPTVPAVRLGRLAIDLSTQGQGLGAALLADAINRSIHSDIACFALIVDAKDKQAAQFYEHHGFYAFANNPHCLYLPLSKALSAS